MKKNWQTWYKIAKEKIENFPNIGGIISAWNTNIDAVVKLSGSQIKTLLQNYTTLDNQEEKIIHSPQDVLRGLIQCFENGIAEEWIVSNEETFEWMKKILVIKNYKWEDKEELLQIQLLSVAFILCLSIVLPFLKCKQIYS